MSKGSVVGWSLAHVSVRNQAKVTGAVRTRGTGGRCRGRASDFHARTGAVGALPSKYQILTTPRISEGLATPGKSRQHQAKGGRDFGVAVSWASQVVLAVKNLPANARRHKKCE